MVHCFRAQTQVPNRLHQYPRHPLVATNLHAVYVDLRCNPKNMVKMTLGCLDERLLTSFMFISSDLPLSSMRFKQIEGSTLR